MAESVSGAASSMGSESSGGTGVDATMLRAEEELGSNEHAFQTGMWGVLYTVSKEKGAIPIWFVIFRLFMDFLQLFLLTVNPLYGFDIKPRAVWWRVVSFIQLNDFMSARGYTFFIISLYLMVAGLVLAVALSVWVAYSFQNNNFSHVWPIQVLRGFATIFFQVLDIASMTLFLMALDCQYFDIHEPHERYHNAEFPSVECWAMPHLVHAAVAVLSLVVFVIMAGLFQLGDMELNLATKNPLAMAHSKVEVMGFSIKVVMTCASVFVNNNKWLSIIQLVSALALLRTYLRWVPHYFNFTNHIRVATYAAIVWSATMFTVLAYHFTADWNNDDARQDFKRSVTLAMWIGLAPVGLLGWLASWLRLRYFHVTIVNRFRTLPSSARPKQFCVFRDPREVEIVARCLRVFIDVDDNLDPDAVQLAEKVIKCGLIQLPKTPFMVIFHSSFLIDVQQSYQTGYTQLQAAKKMDPSFLERFAIFTREQQHTQKSSGGHGGAMDLVAYVEFQRNYSLVLKAHREALLSIRFFWCQLMHQKVQFESLSKAVQVMDKAVQATERAYRLVLQRHSTHVKLIRLYAKFLQQIKHDPWAASKWFDEADKMEVQEEEAKESSILQGLQLDPELRDTILAARPAGGDGDGSGGGGMSGVVLANAHGIIQMTNDTLNNMLGYAKKELLGRNVNILIPPPFSEQHNGYLRNHIATGRMVIQGKVNHLLALHKDGHFLEIKLKVLRVSGTSEDAMFLATMEEVQSSLNTATVWLLPSGHVMSGDAAFTDMSAFKPSEVAGLPLSGIVKDVKDVVAVLREAREAHHAAKEDGEKGHGDHTVSPSKGRSARTPSLLLLDDNETNSFLRGFEQSSAAASTAGSVTGPPTQRRRRISRHWESVRVTSAKDANGNPVSWTLSGVQAKHKFRSDPVYVTMTITNGGIGHHLFHVIKMQRSRPPAAVPPTVTASAGALSIAANFVRKLAANVTDVNAALPPPPPPPSNLVVVDTKGRVAHVTEAFAARLGSTPKLIMANNAQRAMDSLLMEPLSQLHTQHLEGVPPHAYPPFSCRSGLSVLLSRRTNPGKGLDEFAFEGDRGDASYVPFRMALSRTAIDEHTYHVADFTEVKPTQALGERRLLLSIDQHGTILRASRRTPKSLFGFKPSSVVGRSITSIIDVLKPGAPNEPSPTAVLAEMAFKAVESPSVSWRVGVNGHDERPSRGADASLAGRLKPRTRPSVMRLFVRSVEEQQHRYAQIPRQYGFDAEDEEALEELEEQQQEAAAAGQAAPSRTSHEVNAGVMTPASSPGLDATDNATALLGLRGNGDDDEDGAGKDIVIDVELWRADLLLGFVQVDPKGIVTVCSTVWDHMLYDAGLVLGVDLMGLEGMPLSDVLPQLKGKPASELFNPLLSKTAAAAKKRGALKAYKKPGDQRVSIPHALEGVHGFDRAPLGLVVQAVRRATGCWVVVRPNQPQCGRPDFKTFIMGLHNKAEEEEQLTPSRPAAAEDGRGSAGSQQAKDAQTKFHSLPAPALAASPTLAGLDGSKPVANGDTYASPRDQASLLGATDDAKPQKLARDLSISPMPDERKNDGIKAWLASDGKVFPFSEEEAQAPPAPPPMMVEDSPDDQQQAIVAVSTKVAWPEAAVTVHHAAEASVSGSDAEPVGFGVGGAEKNTDGSSEGKGKKQVGGGRGVGGSILEASELDDAEAQGHSVDDQDYKRGRRFKKLVRLLDSPAVHLVRRRFYIQTLGLVVFLLLAHIALFVVIFTLLKSQATYVNKLNEIGQAAVVAAEVAIACRAVMLLMTNQGVKGLRGLQSRADLQAMLDLVDQKSRQFMDLHTAAYTGDQGKKTVMPKKYGLKDIWETVNSGLNNETQYYSIYANETAGNFTIASIVTGTQQLPLFRSGNRYASRAMDIYQNGLDYEASKGNLYQWPQLMYVITNFDSLIAPGYLLTMDNMVQYVIDLAHQVNKVQLIILAAEGVGLCMLAVMYMAYLSNKMAKHRHDIYSVFMMVPMSLVKQLATKRMDLTEEDDDDEDASDPALLAAKNAANAATLNASAHTAGNANGAAAGGGQMRKLLSLKGDRTISGQGSMKDRAKGVWGALAGWLSRKRSGRAETKPKRVLVRTVRQTLLLVLMFALWGVLVIAINAIGHKYLQNIDKPIATFNIVNFVLVLYMRNMFYVQELCALKTDVASVTTYRSFVISKLNELKTEYLVMIYGNKVTTPEQRVLPHFAPVKSGIISSIQRGTDLLFWVRDLCLATDQSWCLQKSDPFYKVVMYGVNQMFVRFLDMGTNIQRLKGLDPALQGPEFQFYWMTRPHMLGGYQALNEVYESYVSSVYTKVRLTHTVLLVMTMVTFATFLLFILRPFMRQASNEPRRIAELLSHLPVDVDIESVLKAKILTASGAPSVPSAANGADMNVQKSAGSLASETSDEFGHALKQPKPKPSGKVAF